MKWSINSDWRNVWKHISTQCMAIYLAGLAVFNELPPFIQSALSPRSLKIIGATLIAMGLAGKYINQGLKNDTSKPSN